MLQRMLLNLVFGILSNSAAAADTAPLKFGVGPFKPDKERNDDRPLARRKT